jgi:hypothetical protein
MLFALGFIFLFTIGGHFKPPKKHLYAGKSSTTEIARPINCTIRKDNQRVI